MQNKNKRDLMREARKKVSGLTLKQKIALCSGGDFWNTKSISSANIKAFKTADGPHGLRCQPKDVDMLGINEALPATCFPTAVTAGSSWDVRLIEREGRAIAEEAAAAGVSVLLGPGCNIKRDPRGGRCFEYYSEDPLLSGRLAAAFVRGVQSRGVIATLKHFAANNQEYKRQNGDSILDERTLRQIYLTPFEIAVKESEPGAVMCSYNKINGVHASDKKELLTDILREEWGFDGLVMTDWGGLNDRVEAFRAGCDLNMPGGSSYMEVDAYNAVVRGELDEACVDESAARVAALSEKCDSIDRGEADFESHHLLAEEIALKGAVLLKNDGILPLDGNDAVIIGSMASDFRYQGSGSSHINPTRLVSIADSTDIPVVSAGDRFGRVTAEELAAARSAAGEHKVAVVVIGLPDVYESEGFDRENICLPQGYLDLIEAVSEVNPSTVAVILGGGAVELPFRDKVKAILYAGLSGQAGGAAVMKLLLGVESPSGKLTESWPVSCADLPCSEVFGMKNTEYREGVFVGYRYYRTAGVEVAYPFGHGLSYTTFEYSDAEFSEDRVSFTVKNTGVRIGEEVSQVYISPVEDRLLRPSAVLCGFARTRLEPGEAKRVEVEVDRYALRYWDGEWKIPGGKYEISVGASSEDIRLSGRVEVKGEEITPDARLSGTWYETLNGKPSRDHWERLMGREIPITPELKKGEFTMDSTCLEMKESSLVMRLQYKITGWYISGKNGGNKDPDNPTCKMMLASSLDGPMRSMVISSNGLMPERIGRGLLAMANGHFFGGLKEMLFPKRRLKLKRNKK